MSESDDSQAAESTTEESTQNTAAKTVLYCKTRAALTAEDLTTIRDALESEGYTLTPSDEGDKVMIQREEGQAVDPSDILG